jgi:hypothetical protein
MTDEEEFNISHEMWMSAWNRALMIVLIDTPGGTFLQECERIATIVEMLVGATDQPGLSDEEAARRARFRKRIALLVPSQIPDYLELQANAGYRPARRRLKWASEGLAKFVMDRFEAQFTATRAAS